MLDSELHLNELVENDMRYISDRMREIRENYGESQMDFAETLQLSRSTVARQESGLQGLSLDYLLRLLRATKTPVKSLFPHDLYGMDDDSDRIFSLLNEGNKRIVQHTMKVLAENLLATQGNIS